jgi:sulfur carrier protein
MNIVVNGQEKEFQDNITLLGVMQNLKIEQKVMAAAVNMEIVKKENWDSFQPKEDDKIELLHFVGGG